MSRLFFLAAAILMASGCATASPPCPEGASPNAPCRLEDPARARQIQAAAPAVKALQEARFEDALRESSTVIEKDKRNATVHAVWAVAEYRKALHDLVSDGLTFLRGLETLNPRLFDFALSDADRRLAVVEEHLAKAAEDPAFSLDLCLGCWQVDWNRSGRIDSGDQLLLQVEYDADGQELPEGDPRRTPTFRFDAADIAWLRAMINFQRAGLNVVLAYDVIGAVHNVKEWVNGRQPLVIKLRDESRVHRARDLILAGLQQARLTREQILAETDDEREWVPNPRQKNHPLPLPVDDALFQTWEGVVSDLEGLLRSQQGLSVEELAQLGDHQWSDPPQGFVDVGALMSKPGDIVLDLKKLEGAAERTHAEGLPNTRATNVEALLSDVLGAKYKSSMAPTRLIQRLSRMKGEVERGEERFERKLRYLFWLN